jgi:glycosyltransferase involved in cell wall biosynthesis
VNNDTSKPQAILMIAYTDYGSDARVIRAAQAAATAGFEVDVLALRRAGDPPSEHMRGVRVFHLTQSRYRGRGHLRYLLAYLLFFWRCFLKTSFLFLKRRYRVIHVHNMPDFLVFCTVMPKILGAKVVLDIHDPMPNTFASKFRSGERGFFYRMLLWQELLSARYSDRVVTVHDPVKNGILVKHGLAAESIHVIANFPDTDLFACRATYQVDGQVRLAFHGTILERSGIRNLIIALSRVQHRERIRARIIGEGDFSAGLQRLIRDHALEDVVEFDNRFYPLYEIPSRIADCNVGIIPLEISSVTNYALPLKLLEYISMGLPVVSVRSAAICYYFREEDCLFYDWNDVESLRRLLDRLAEKPELLQRYRRRAVELRGKYSWNTERKKYIALLQDLIAKPKTVAGTIRVQEEPEPLEPKCR